MRDVAHGRRREIGAVHDIAEAVRWGRGSATVSESRERPGPRWSRTSPLQVAMEIPTSEAVNRPGLERW
ncbi:hypothetical protein GCM10026982_00350 [Nocardiopsis aegyptia]